MKVCDVRLLEEVLSSGGVQLAALRGEAQRLQGGRRRNCRSGRSRRSRVRQLVATLEASPHRSAPRPPSLLGRLLSTSDRRRAEPRWLHTLEVTHAACRLQLVVGSAGSCRAWHVHAQSRRAARREGVHAARSRRGGLCGGGLRRAALRRGGSHCEAGGVLCIVEEFRGQSTGLRCCAAVLQEEVRAALHRRPRGGAAPRACVAVGALRRAHGDRRQSGGAERHRIY